MGVNVKYLYKLPVSISKHLPWIPTNARGMTLLPFRHPDPAKRDSGSLVLKMRSRFPLSPPPLAGQAGMTHFFPLLSSCDISLLFALCSLLYAACVLSPDRADRDTNSAQTDLFSKILKCQLTRFFPAFKRIVKLVPVDTNIP